MADDEKDRGATMLGVGSYLNRPVPTEALSYARSRPTMPIMGSRLLTYLTMASFVLAASAGAQSRGDGLAVETKNGLALMDRYQIATQSGATTIYVHTISVHHIRAEYASVATRDADGHWAINSVGEEGAGLADIPVRMIPQAPRRLSNGENLALNALLRRSALYRVRPKMPRDIAIGAAFHTMEIVGPKGHVVVQWVGRLKGPAGQVADLIIGRG